MGRRWRRGATSRVDTDVLAGSTARHVLAAVLDTTVDAVVVLRPVSGDGHVIDFECILANPAVEHVLGVSAADVVGSRIGTAIPGAQTWMPAFIAAVASGEPFANEFEWTDRNGRRVVAMRARPVRVGDFDGVVIVLNDGTAVHHLTTSVDDLQERQRELELQALHDPLTGCANRLLVESRLEHAISRLDRHAGIVAALFVDLDGFKDVNDTHGHAAGDVVLATIADRLRSEARTYDTVGRLGGDEFVVVCEDLHDAADLDRIGRRILDTCGGPVDIGSDTVTVTASVGVAITESPDTCAADLIGAADSAMYRAKSYRGGWVSFADDDAERRRIVRHDLELGLSAAVDRGEVVTELAPIVRADTGTVVGFDATVRWNHHAHGPIDNDTLHRTALVIGLAAALTDHLVDAAARRLAALPATERQPVSVTVSGDVLCDPGFADRVGHRLRRHDLTSAALFIAIDGSFLATHTDRCVRVLDQLHHMGVRVIRDRLGAAGSALTYIDAVAVEYVRFDPTLVAGIGDPRRHGLVSTICEASTAINRRTIAPSVRNADQVEQFRALGVDYLQGPFITHAVASGDAALLELISPAQ